MPQGPRHLSSWLGAGRRDPATGAAKETLPRASHLHHLHCKDGPGLTLFCTEFCFLGVVLNYLSWFLSSVSWASSALS